ncbi:hypothetical protein [Polymorphospora rubra]|uniref:Uncharacterized protein n=1 Tax=Polymorphospora rubra TaxID=338584 RepID=A0A810MYT2_9ACTN|nr:hypothetical protein [Polymorphospora rubra]BCJ66262.1 hypothetical protein Prubr_32830 [Polymorphospora rubra]
MRTAVKVLVGLTAAVVVGVGGAGIAQAAAPGQVAAPADRASVAASWILWNSYVNISDPNAAKAQCELAGARGVVQGRWLDHRCDFNGIATYTLWIYR